MASESVLSYIPEPDLTFGYGQSMPYPKDGLMLFGPLAYGRAPAEVRVGIVGHASGLARYKRWVKKINGYIPPERDVAHHSSYPGFETVFGCKWPEEPICALEVPEDQIRRHLYLSDRHEAIYKTVELYEQAIARYCREEEGHVDLWFVVILEEIFQLGRPKSVVPKELQIRSAVEMNARRARALQIQPTLFTEDNEAAELYRYELHFHNQLKARLLQSRAVVQVVRETSLAPEDFVTQGRPLRRVQDPATLAWNLTTTSFFKASGRPWKLTNVRDGVCYVGLVFKQDETSGQVGNACCGAQMFLDSGDGLVFKGAVGPWYSSKTGEFHLSREKASALMGMVVDAYRQQHRQNPKEMFIHGRTRFDWDEWNGFRDSVPRGTNLVGIRIRDDKTLKLYEQGRRPVLRGTACQVSTRKGYLWTRGYVTRLQTYAGREVPNPMSIEICRGTADLRQVMGDIMGLTKVNFNACIYADGYPVTLRFADRVGEILTAAPMSASLPPLPFKHYI